MTYIIDGFVPHWDTPTMPRPHWTTLACTKSLAEARALLKAANADPRFKRGRVLAAGVEVTI